MQHKNKINIWRSVSSVLIIFLFLLVVIFYFFMFRIITAPSDSVNNEVIEQQTEQLTEEQNFAKASLSLRDDIKRFLEVLLTQDFQNERIKGDFIQQEYIRFLDYPTQSEQDQELLIALINQLGELMDKSKDLSADFEPAMENLENLYNQI